MCWDSFRPLEFLSVTVEWFFKSQTYINVEGMCNHLKMTVPCLFDIDAMMPMLIQLFQKLFEKGKSPFLVSYQTVWSMGIWKKIKHRWIEVEDQNNFCIIITFSPIYVLVTWHLRTQKLPWKEEIYKCCCVTSWHAQHQLNSAVRVKFAHPVCMWKFCTNSAKKKNWKFSYIHSVYL